HGSRRCRLRMNRVEQYNVRGPAEWRLATEQFVQHHSQTILIARRQRIALLALGLFRSHVRWCAQDGAVLGYLLGRILTMGQAEIHDMGLPLYIEHDIGWLGVTMHDSLIMRVSEPLGQVLHDLRYLAEGQLILLNSFRQGLPLDKRRCNVILAAITAGVVDRHDMGMAQPRRCLGFAQESLR